MDAVPSSSRSKRNIEDRSETEGREKKVKYAETVANLYGADVFQPVAEEDCAYFEVVVQKKHRNNKLKMQMESEIGSWTNLSIQNIPLRWNVHQLAKIIDAVQQEMPAKQLPKGRDFVWGLIKATLESTKDDINKLFQNGVDLKDTKFLNILVDSACKTIPSGRVRANYINLFGGHGKGVSTRRVASTLRVMFNWFASYIILKTYADRPDVGVDDKNNILEVVKEDLNIIYNSFVDFRDKFLEQCIFMDMNAFGKALFLKRTDGLLINLDLSSQVKSPIITESNDFVEENNLSTNILETRGNLAVGFDDENLCIIEKLSALYDQYKFKKCFQAKCSFKTFVIKLIPKVDAVLSLCNERINLKQEDVQLPTTSKASAENEDDRGHDKLEKREQKHADDEDETKTVEKEEEGESFEDDEIKLFEKEIPAIDPQFGWDELENYFNQC